MTRQRVAITGLGVVAPNGVGLPAFLDALLTGRSGIRQVWIVGPASLPTRIAGEVRTALPAPLPDRKIGFALEAAREAFAQATASGSAPRGLGGLSLGVGLELFSMDDLAAERAGRRMPPAPGERLSFMQTPSDPFAPF